MIFLTHRFSKKHLSFVEADNISGKFVCTDSCFENSILHASITKELITSRLPLNSSLALLIRGELRQTKSAGGFFCDGGMQNFTNFLKAVLLQTILSR